jgi:hypothetical protein
MLTFTYSSIMRETDRKVMQNRQIQYAQWKTHRKANRKQSYGTADKQTHMQADKFGVASEGRQMGTVEDRHEISTSNREPEL